MNWNQLFIRHGWLLEQEKEHVWNGRTETAGNLEFLLKTLDKVNASYSYNGGTLVLQSGPVSEERWIRALDERFRGRGGDLWFQPGKEEPKVEELDVYIAGVVRQLNRLGLYTLGSCDGHGQRPAHVLVLKEKKEPLLRLLDGIGMGKMRMREHGDTLALSFPFGRRKLLVLAERLSHVEKSWLEHGGDFIRKQLFFSLLEEMLSIPGESGKEGKIRKAVGEKLAPFVDHLFTDRHGNLLAEKRYKSGNGPVILLNAHLDVVQELVRGRKILKEGGIWRSSEGILGADDRAGVAILLHLAERLENSSFSGTVKFIFSVGEEIGLVGASQVDEYFLWGTDAAIVVDRRGNGDIVTSCGGYIPFCHPEYGEFFERTARKEGLSGWKCTEGGSSDARIWAGYGIETVNLSAGYRNEHWENEYLDVEASFSAVKLLEGVFENSWELARVLRSLRSRKVF